jgi:hypothetical protein
MLAISQNVFAPFSLFPPRLEKQTFKKPSLDLAVEVFDLDIYRGAVKLEIKAFPAPRTSLSARGWVTITLASLDI